MPVYSGTNTKERIRKYMRTVSELNGRMLTVKEVANLLNVHPGTIRRWEKKGHLKSYRIGLKGVIRFNREDLSDYITNHNNGH
jgi:excisionase family DNA binding protein